MRFFCLEPHQTRCCTDDGQLLELANSPDHCFPLLVPNDDPAHSQTNTKCINFVRTITTQDRRCVSPYTPAEQVIFMSKHLLTQINSIFPSIVDCSKPFLGSFHRLR